MNIRGFKLRTAALLLVLGFHAGGLMYGSPFQNGSFESPTLTESIDFIDIPAGWSVTNDFANDDTFWQTDGGFQIPYVPANGHQSFGFGGNGYTGAVLSQTFDTTVGQDYTVTFQYLIQQGNQTQSLEVDATDSSAINLVTDQISFSNRLAWAESLVTFTATTTSTTLSFTDITPLANGTATNWALDAVTVGATVPEPCSAGFVGFGMLSAWLWFRRGRLQHLRK